MRSPTLFSLLALNQILAQDSASPIPASPSDATAAKKTAAPLAAGKESKQQKKLQEKAILCDICQLGVEQGIELKFTEETVEDICEPKKKSGRWLTKLDLINGEEGRLEVSIPGGFGKCKKECSMMAKTCRKVFDTDRRQERLVKMIAQNFDRETMIRKLCQNKVYNSDFVGDEDGISKKSKKKAAAATKKKDVKIHPCFDGHEQMNVERGWNEEFDEIDQKLAEMDDMMADMKAKTGMGMKMYSREELTTMSEGDMEAMAARESLAQDRQEEKYRQTGSLGPESEDL